MSTTSNGGSEAARFRAVNLISDPIHGYIELTKRLTPEGAACSGCAASANSRAHAGSSLLQNTAASPTGSA